MIVMIKENTQKVVGKVEETTQPIVSPVYKAARSLLLASIGALALTKEEIETLVNRLVEKGEITEKEGRKLIEEITARTKETHKDVTEKVSKKVGEPIGKKDELMEKMEEAFTQRVQAILNSMNIPSKSDIEELTKKIDKLARKVSELDKKLVAEGKVVDVEPAKAKATTKKAA
jgi:poly(hydroxyalkanoate) granule-associated protein